MARRVARAGIIATLVLTGLYVGVVASVSGWPAMRSQFLTYWYFLLPLWIGFGLQVGLYVSLRQLLKAQRPSRSLVAATGTSSTAAMLACCTHYLANLVPVLGASGLVVFVSQYQAELFWFALLINAAGIVLMLIRRHRINQEFVPMNYERTSV